MQSAMPPILNLQGQSGRENEGKGHLRESPREGAKKGPEHIDIEEKAHEHRLSVFHFISFPSHALRVVVDHGSHC